MSNDYEQQKFNEYLIRQGEMLHPEDREAFARYQREQERLPLARPMTPQAFDRLATRDLYRGDGSRP